MPTALICGGGVAGLSSALHLKQQGWKVQIFESDSELRTAGVGLNIWPNGVRVLDGLGLGAQFRSFAAAMDRWWALDSDGELTSDIDVSHWNELLGAPVTGARRRRLNAMLADALDPAEIQFNTTAVGYTQTDDTVTVHFEDGRSATGDVLLGADGIGSRIRNAMFGAPRRSPTRRSSAGAGCSRPHRPVSRHGCRPTCTAPVATSGGSRSTPRTPTGTARSAGSRPSTSSARSTTRGPTPLSPDHREQ